MGTHCNLPNFADQWLLPKRNDEMVAEEQLSQATYSHWLSEKSKRSAMPTSWIHRTAATEYCFLHATAFMNFKDCTTSPTMANKTLDLIWNRYVWHRMVDRWKWTWQCHWRHMKSLFWYMPDRGLSTIVNVLCSPSLIGSNYGWGNSIDRHYSRERDWISRLSSTEIIIIYQGRQFISETF